MMADYRLGSVREDGRHAVPAGGELAVADRVDPVVNAVQAADAGAVLDGVAAQPQVKQLPKCDYPMLPTREGSDFAIYLPM